MAHTSHLEKLSVILTHLEDLMEDRSFIDDLDGEEQGFLDTIWDFFDRLEKEFDPELTIEIEPNWEIQQDAETD